MSSLSSQPHRRHYQYDVFLNFRGDTPQAFTSDLYTALTLGKIKTFIDTRLEMGKELIPGLLRAIEGSRISIVVFSERYAGSRWCLDELMKIMECHRTIGQRVLLVFYRVGSYHVRHQKGAFGAYFERLSGSLDAHVLSGWRRALSDAAYLPGWHVTDDLDHLKIINEIVDYVLGFLPSPKATYLPITDFDVSATDRFSGDKIPSQYCRYDVFLSFRGEDSCHSFISHLHAALISCNIKTFMDTRLEKETELRPYLLRAIEGSRISIVVFSQGYAKSSCCLDELVKIMECYRTIDQVILPIFYYVEPSHVRHQKGAFEDAYLLSSWRRALTVAGNLPGWHVTKDTFKSDIIRRIVDDVLKKLDNTSMSITNFPVGLESRAQDMIQLLEGQSSTVYVIGIWGIAGSGKTTLAKFIYNQIHRNFESTSFLANIGEVWETKESLVDLQEQLLFDILKSNKMNIHNVEMRKDMINKALYQTKALVVLDDVSKNEQLEALCGNPSWMRPGSVVIITSRYARMLKLLKVHHAYEMKGMDHFESLQLFSWHAFREEMPRPDFIELSNKVIRYSGGLPLVLEVLGSYLCGRKLQKWISALRYLEKLPDGDLQRLLRISFDGLKNHMEKDIFLDICCFFIGKKRTYVIDILDGCGLDAEIGITVLIKRSLIKVEKNNKIGMHWLLREMGRKIVRERSPKEPEKQSRLWLNKDVLHVLRGNTGTKAIEGLALKLQRSSTNCFNTKVFMKMKRLRLLQLNQVQLFGDFGYLPKHLRWIDWQGFPLMYIPNNFYQENLVAIDLRRSNLKLVWKEPQLLERLKILNLSHSKYLMNTPSFSKLPNLERLILKDCPCLSRVHRSIGDLNNLLLINLKDCTNLKNLPRTIYKLKSLKSLIISGCSKIDKLEEGIVQMEGMTTLIANDTAIKQVPFSIIRMQSIAYISLCGFEGLSCDIFPSLTWSWMSPTSNPLSYIHSFGGMLSSLVSISIHIQSKNLGDISSVLISISNLRSVRVQCCPKFQQTQDFKRILDHLYDVNFTKLKTSYALQSSKDSVGSFLIGIGSYDQVIGTLHNSISQGLTICGPNDFILPGDNYPYWLSHASEGDSVVFKVPQVSDYHLRGMILCVIYSTTPGNMADESLISVLIVNYTKHVIQLFKGDTIKSLNDKEWEGIASNLEPKDQVEIYVACGHGLVIKKTALYLIYYESIEEQVGPLEEPMTPGAMLGPDQTESSTPITMLSEPVQPITVLLEPDLIESSDLDRKVPMTSVPVLPRPNKKAKRKPPVRRMGSFLCAFFKSYVQN